MTNHRMGESKKMKKRLRLSLVVVLSLVVSICASMTTFAASEKRVETKQGGYVTVSNVVEEIKFIDEGAMVGDTVYVANAPVTITINGDAPNPFISYRPNAQLEGKYFSLGTEREDVEVTENVAVLKEPGYYAVTVPFGNELSLNTVAAFVVQVVGETSDESDGESNEETNTDPEENTEPIELGFPGDGTYINVGKTIDFTASVYKSQPVEIIFYSSDPTIASVGDDHKITGLKEGVVTITVKPADDQYTGEASMSLHVLKKPDETNNNDSDEGTNTEPVEAKPTASKVLVNGEEVSFQAFNISNNNYFKLRDLAMIANGTEKSFEVSWDGLNNAISLESGKAYTAVGGELVVPNDPTSMEATPTVSKIYLNGNEVEFTAYNINGNNYFKLRDVAKAINFGVTWDGSTYMIGVSTSSDYVEE
jgi:hypothetical protein